MCGVCLYNIYALLHKGHRVTKTPAIVLMKKTKQLITCNMILWCMLLSFAMPSRSEVAASESNGEKEEVKIGLVVDLNSSMGVMVESCIAMAQSDFYKNHPSYRTKLAFHTKNSHDVFAAASGALELLKNEEVRAMLGPLTSPEAKFVVELGEKAQVPIISFSATSSNISPLQSPYFIRTAAADSSQLKAITALFQGFEWKKVIIVYEDTGYQYGFIRDITHAFQEVDIKISGMSAVSANDSQILEELKKLKAMSTRVFLVHMNSLLGSRLFLHAKTMGMMSKGYGWLMTDESSNLLNSMDDEAIDAMEGVLGIRPYVPKSRDLAILKTRQERELQFSKPKAVLNIFGLWAYDAVWALAMAVERIGPINSIFVKQTKRQNASDMASLGSFEVGPVLLKEILNTKFNGLSGEFNLVNGQLQISTFEILHVIGKGERTIGYWTPDRGLSRHPHSTNKSSNYSTSASVLKNIIWPGDTTVKPLDWDLPTSGKKLKVGVPVKEGFTEFVKLKQDPITKEYSITGFCADIFNEVLAHLPKNIDKPQFIPFQDRNGKSAGSYNDLLKQLELKEYDLVVADVTILPDRAQRVDFSRSYMETEVVMLRQIKYNKGKDIWIFIKPLSSDLWLTIALTCIFMGLIIRTLERRVNREQQPGMWVWFPLASLAFPERSMVASNWSKFVLVIWLFTAFIVIQSYTANLSSIFTIAQLKRSRDRPYCIGFQDGSFVRELLIDRLHFNESKMKSYASAEQYHDALSKGCNNGGVDAIFDELPFIKIFIDTYGENNYKLEGSSYSTGGLGFAFQKGSPLASIISTAILELTGSGSMHAIMTKNFGLEYSDRNYFPNISSYSSSIGVMNLAGLFIISGSMTLLALVFSSPSFQRLYASMSLRCRQNFVFPAPTSDSNGTSAQSSAETIINGNLSTTAIPENSISIPIQSDEDVVAVNRRETENNSDKVNGIGEGDVNHPS